MILDCFVDGRGLSLTVNAVKPLRNILTEELNNRSLSSACNGGGCGNCVVLVDDKAVLSCLVPAFRLQGANIVTFDGFSKTRAYRDIRKAYQEAHIKPCRFCYASRTLMIESLVKSLLNQTYRNSKSQGAQEIVREFSLNTCNCLNPADLLDVVDIALRYRRRKYAGRA